MDKKHIGIFFINWDSVHTRILSGFRRTLTELEPQWSWEVASSRSRTKALLSKHTDGIILGPGQALPDGWTGPYVRVSDQSLSDYDRPAAQIDQRAVGSVAAKHLIEMGYQHAACYFRSSDHSNHQRVLGFCDTMQQHGYNVALFDSDSYSKTHHARENARWLCELPPGSGIFCPNDGRAAWIRQQCSVLDLTIPQHIGLVSAGDIPSACFSCKPELSSVLIPWEALGSAALHAIRRQLAGSTAHHAEQLRPTVVQRRASTARERPTNSLTNKAIKFLQAHLTKRPSTPQVAKYLGVSAATINRHFRQTTGLSIQQWYHHQLIQYAQILMTNHDLTMKEIATQCGYDDYSHFYRLFVKITGTSPTLFRNNSV